LSEYEGPANVHLGDARHLPFEDERYDVVSIQGGLHHLQLMDDLEQSLSEIRRVLKPQGKLLLVEPWLTPFLRVVHAACESSLCRKAWNKLDALATMIDHERDTYFDWLSRPQPILERLEAVVEFQSVRIGWGKLMLLGVKR
jgi:ubiquinone/menaquinone biosynthesis C-methylase UbiE